MTITKQQIRRYFHDTMAVDVFPELWQPSRRLPLFLRESYTYYEIDILGAPCLLMADHDADRSAANIQKHFEQIRAKWDGETIYARDRITAVDRKRLIERKIPFVVPGNQMYLPMLGIDLREHFRRIRDQAPKVSPASQAAILLLLTDCEPNEYDAKALAERLGYSKMTASRSLGELQRRDLGVIRLEGRPRLLALDGARRVLWDRAMPMLQDPVKHRQHVRCESSESVPFGRVTAGLTALAAYSMLAAPRVTTIAMTSEQWKKLEANVDIEKTNPNDPDAVEIEVWSYDPLLFAKSQTCDPYSLFLSLQHNTDERVQSALEEMMEAMEW